MAPPNRFIHPSLPHPAGRIAPAANSATVPFDGMGTDIFRPTVRRGFHRILWMMKERRCGSAGWRTRIRITVCTWFGGSIPPRHWRRWGPSRGCFGHGNCRMSWHGCRRRPSESSRTTLRFCWRGRSASGHSSMTISEPPQRLDRRRRPASNSVTGHFLRLNRIHSCRSDSYRLNRQRPWRFHPRARNRLRLRPMLGCRKIYERTASEPPRACVPNQVRCSSAQDL